MEKEILPPVSLTLVSVKQEAGGGGRLGDY